MGPSRRSSVRFQARVSLGSRCSEKGVSAVAISHDGLFVTFADKFGVVWVLVLDEDGDSQASVDKKAVPMLGHYCSIITSLEFSPDGQFIATADRDFKIHITKFPKRPLNGAYEIQSFCLGHTEYAYGIMSLDAFLITCAVGAKWGLGFWLAYYSSSKRLAFINYSLNGTILLKCELSARTLSVAKVVYLEDSIVPTRIGLVRLRVISDLHKCLSDSDGDGPVVLEDNEIPGGKNLLAALQGSLDVSKEAGTLAATAAALKAAMNNLLIKKQVLCGEERVEKKE